MLADGQDALVQLVATHMPHVYVHDVGVLSEWGERVGFTLDELARIQPGYRYFFYASYPKVAQEGSPSFVEHRRAMAAWIEGQLSQGIRGGEPGWEALAGVGKRLDAMESGSSPLPDRRVGGALELYHRSGVPDAINPLAMPQSTGFGQPMLPAGTWGLLGATLDTEQLLLRSDLAVSLLGAQGVVGRDDGPARAAASGTWPHRDRTGAQCRSNADDGPMGVADEHGGRGPAAKRTRAYRSCEDRSRAVLCCACR